ncbi:HlyD family efflux transporter periplasmic adaptor subunit [Caenimonas koreensis DSM 17982]|uniref:HlyD family efflux transporter periplasmic adaptor subunit n=1 Tax=Caenimonas koreensis DSM 17982 TaxID=1121255 RepID=A0A844B9B2_9BURK|nr:HlyD family efflux transporter periplasmic adaptor subunit [Caenimonas koreensis]MRD47111.1 HlyD family efflux transporter periplasmic adaptor subunit [Caenimonas koreensis DSM 17982]
MTSSAGHGATAPALGDLLHLEQRAFSALNTQALGFTIVNETSLLGHFRQAAFFVTGATGALTLCGASGLVSVVGDTPYSVWVTQLAKTLAPQPPVQLLDIGSAPESLVDGWQEWLPEHLLACNLKDSEGTRIGLVIYARDEAWQEHELSLIARIHETYGYCLQALARTPGPWKSLAARLLQRRTMVGAAIALAIALLIPVRLSAVAPAEVVALSAVAIASPQEGVVGAFHVQPNTPVKAGDKLFSLDDRGLESRRAVAARALQTARADALLAEQRAFDDAKSKGELAAAQGRVKEKEAELALVEGTLERVTVRAPADGVIIFGDANDWLGRPVQTGERIMQLADPRDAGVMVWLPVADAINLEPGAPIRLFLHTQPLSPLSASLLETSYQAVQSPAGVSSYRVRGRFEQQSAGTRIGLRGTARVSGEWTCLGYYFLRRPIAAVREWTGL